MAGPCAAGEGVPLDDLVAEIIDAFRGQSLGAVAAQHDLARGVRPIGAIVVLARDLTAGPADNVEPGVNQLGAGIGFVERYL